MNETYGSLFKLPEPKIKEETATVPGLDGAKMSKSYGNTLPLFLEEAVMRKKVMSIKTDSTPVEAPKPIENSVILDLYQHVASPVDYNAMKASFQAGGNGYGVYKKQLFDGIWEYLAPMRVRREEILRDPSYVDAVLKEGAEKANLIANQVLERVREAVGLR
ncbi:MAG: hypothetical protein FJ390_03165 [Verrucomicrobia bacterium]|nr:hypothetical protein [Verrucomicrobiota bacterium]